MNRVIICPQLVRTSRPFLFQEAALPRLSRRALLTGAVAAASTAALSPTAARAAARPLGGARVVAETYVDSRTLDLTIDSPALANPAVKVRLLLPPGWTPTPTRSWPVLYLLHGAHGDHTNWTSSTDVASLAEDTGVLVVMPDGGRVGFYSDWWNYGHGGAPAWERFHLVELVRILEGRYGAGTRRAIAGLSMGGFGAMSYAARHPDMFRAAAAYSGVVHTTYIGPHAPSPWDGPGVVQNAFLEDALDPDVLWGDPISERERWAAHCPHDLAHRLKRMPLYLSCGNGKPGPFEPPGTPADTSLEPLLEITNRVFVDRLHQVGANVTANLYGPGIHNWPYWQRELHASFPLLMSAVGA
ncbi:alpha/beta hydrolase family protein [Streptomyces sp. AK02-04a]|uniref:alpha/beta hydrolase n=1 Tax=Streptomyces sp. AK02-04a TaxID=3028649 RepID=UPI0029B4B2F7|nr:alpha/beta hydrolase family protein [Streptomyces sp. AK02-04a]MDX3763918.1 alpha/beta hydrolase family protein [Streptomyces sp. AK02-04a]